MIIFIATLFVCLTFIIVGIIIVLIIYGVFDRSIRHTPVTPSESIIPQSAETIFAQPAGLVGIGFGSLMSASDMVIAVAARSIPQSVYFNDVYLYHPRKLHSLIARPIHMKDPVTDIAVVGEYVFIATPGNISVFNRHGQPIWHITGSNKSFSTLIKASKDLSIFFTTCQENDQYILYAYGLNAGEWHIAHRMNIGTEAIIDITSTGDWLGVATEPGRVSIFHKYQFREFIQTGDHMKMIRIHGDKLFVARSDNGQIECFPLSGDRTARFFVNIDPFPLRDFQINESTGHIAAVLASGDITVIRQYKIGLMVTLITKCCPGSTTVLWMSTEHLLVTQPDEFNGTGVFKRLVVCHPNSLK